LATNIDPHFNPWRPVEAFGQRLLREQSRWPSFQEALKLVGETARPLLTLPTHLENLLIETNRGRLKVQVTPDRSLDRQLRNIESASRRLYWGGLFVALLSSGTILYVNQETLLGLVGWGLSGLTLLGALLAGRRRRS
jgi:hypothetical protein